MSNSLKERYDSSPLHGDNAAAVESMYERYVTDPSSVPEGWRRYFDTLSGEGAEGLYTPIRKRLIEAVQANGGSATTMVVKQGKGVSDEKQAAVSRLIQVYSLRGHQIANLDPLNLYERHVPGVLRLDYLGLTEADMGAEFVTVGLAGSGDKRMKLRDILTLLRKIYCGKVGIRELVIGMAHRGRINVLVNVLGKSPEELFEEFEGNVDPEDMKGSGDVKYHKGYSADMKTAGGNAVSYTHLTLPTNREV